MAIKVTLMVRDNRELAILLGVVDGFAKLVEASPYVEPKSSPKVRYAAGKKDKGISGKDLLVRCLESGPRTVDELTVVFITNGFAPSSAGSFASQAVKDGLAKRNGDGRYHLIESKPAT